jgi:hypothetical protein
MSFYVFLSILKKARSVPTGKNWLDKIKESLKSEIILAYYNFLLWEEITNQNPITF